MRERIDGVGKRVKALRDARGFDQGEFALKIGLSQAYLSKIESGKRNPGPAKLVKIASGFGLSLDELLAGLKPQRGDLLDIKPPESDPRQALLDDAETLRRRLLVATVEEVEAIWNVLRLISTVLANPEVDRAVADIHRRFHQE